MWCTARAGKPLSVPCWAQGLDDNGIGSTNCCSSMKRSIAGSGGVSEDHVPAKLSPGLMPIAGHSSQCACWTMAVTLVRSTLSWGVPPPLLKSRLLSPWIWHPVHLLSARAAVQPLGWLLVALGCASGGLLAVFWWWISISTLHACCLSVLSFSSLISSCLE